MSDWYGCYKQGWGELMANPDAFAHPAKGARGLARRIYEYALEKDYFERGQTVIDPFAGVGGFAFHAMRFGMHFIGVELEQRFVDYASGYDCPGYGKAFFKRFWHRLDRLNYKLFHLCPACVRELKAGDFDGVMPEQGAHRYQGNIELWNERYKAHFRDWGSAVIVQGDSRRLGEVLRGEMAGAVSSPPYTGNYKSDRTNVQRDERRLGKDFTGRGRGCFRGSENYGLNPHNLGNLPAGELDEALAGGAVSSPPFMENNANIGAVGDTPAMRQQIHKSRPRPQSYGTTPGQLASLPSGTVDAAVSSPPYAASTASDDPDKRGGLFRDPKRRGDKTLTARYDSEAGQLGAMRGGDFEGAVSSPPFCDSDNRGAAKMPDDYFVRSDGSSFGEGRATRATLDNPDNLGNQSQETFWSAARAIVQQLYQVLAPGSYAAFVVKSFVRNKQLVDFPGQWRQLCEACGFDTVEVIRAWLVEDKGKQFDLFGELHERTIERKSFFRRLAESKGSPRIDYEVVLWMRKPPDVQRSRTNDAGLITRGSCADSA